MLSNAMAAQSFHERLDRLEAGCSQFARGSARRGHCGAADRIARMARADHAPAQLLGRMRAEMPILDDALDGICSEVAHHALKLSIRSEPVDLGAVDLIVVASTAPDGDADGDVVSHGRS